LVNSEIFEIKGLIEQLLQTETGVDEIVVVQDFPEDITESQIEIGDKLEVFKYLSSLDGRIIFKTHPLNENFAVQKNFLNSNCTKDFILNLDADEKISNELIATLPSLLDMNPDIDAYWFSRANIVEGITQEHLLKWGWSKNENDFINWPDPQLRLYRNCPEIGWIRPVHELLTGYKKVSYLPQEKEWAIYHNKDIKTQENQNEHYSQILKNPNIHRRGY